MIDSFEFEINYQNQTRQLISTVHGHIKSMFQLQENSLGKFNATLNDFIAFGSLWLASLIRKDFKVKTFLVPFHQRLASLCKSIFQFPTPEKFKQIYTILLNQKFKPYFTPLKSYRDLIQMQQQLNFASIMVGQSMDNKSQIKTNIDEQQNYQLQAGLEEDLLQLKSFINTQTDMNTSIVQTQIAIYSNRSFDTGNMISNYGGYTHCLTANAQNRFQKYGQLLNKTSQYNINDQLKNKTINKRIQVQRLRLISTLNCQYLGFVNLLSCKNFFTEEQEHFQNLNNVYQKFNFHTLLRLPFENHVHQDMIQNKYPVLQLTFGPNAANIFQQLSEYKVIQTQKTRAMIQIAENVASKLSVESNQAQLFKQLFNHDVKKLINNIEDRTQNLIVQLENKFIRSNSNPSKKIDYSLNQFKASLESGNLLKKHEQQKIKTLRLNLIKTLQDNDIINSDQAKKLIQLVGVNIQTLSNNKMLGSQYIKNTGNFLNFSKRQITGIIKKTQNINGQIQLSTNVASHNIQNSTECNQLWVINMQNNIHLVSQQLQHIIANTASIKQKVDKIYIQFMRSENGELLKSVNEQLVNNSVLTSQVMKVAMRNQDQVKLLIQNLISSQEGMKQPINNVVTYLDKIIKSNLKSQMNVSHISQCMNEFSNIFGNQVIQRARLMNHLSNYIYYSESKNSELINNYNTVIQSGVENLRNKIYQFEQNNNLSVNYISQLLISVKDSISQNILDQNVYNYGIATSVLQRWQSQLSATQRKTFDMLSIAAKNIVEQLNVSNENNNRKFQIIGLTMEKYRQYVDRQLKSLANIITTGNKQILKQDSILKTKLEEIKDLLRQNNEQKIEEEKENARKVVTFYQNINKNHNHQMIDLSKIIAQNNNLSSMLDTILLKNKIDSDKMKTEMDNLSHQIIEKDYQLKDSNQIKLKYGLVKKQIVAFLHQIAFLNNKSVLISEDLSDTQLIRVLTSLKKQLEFDNSSHKKIQGFVDGILKFLNVSSVQSADDRIRGFVKTLESNSQEIQTLKNNISIKTQFVNSHDSQIKETRKQVEVKQKQIQILKSKQSQYKNTIAQAKTQAKILTNEVELLKEKSIKCQKQLAQTKAILKERQSNNIKSEYNADLLYYTNKSHSKQLDWKDQDRSRLYQKNISQLNVKLDNIQLQLSNQKSRNAKNARQLRNHIEQLVAQKNDLDKNLVLSKQKLKNLNQTQQRRQRELHSMNSQLKTLKNKFDEKISNYVQLQNKLTQINQKKAAYEIRLELLEEQNRAYEIKVEKHNKLQNQNQSEIKKLKKKIQQLEKQKVVINQNMITNQSKLQALLSQSQQNKTILQNEIKVKIKLENQILKLKKIQQELSTLRSQLNTSQKQVQRLNESIENINQINTSFIKSMKSLPTMLTQMNKKQSKGKHARQKKFKQIFDKLNKVELDESNVQEYVNYIINFFTQWKVFHEKQIQLKQAQYQQVLSDKNKIEQVLQERDKHISELQKKDKTIQQQINLLYSQRLTSNMKVVELQQRNKQYLSQLILLKQQLNNLTSKSNIAKNSVDQLNLIKSKRLATNINQYVNQSQYQLLNILKGNNHDRMSKQSKIVDFSISGVSGAKFQFDWDNSQSNVKYQRLVKRISQYIHQFEPQIDIQQETDPERMIDKMLAEIQSRKSEIKKQEYQYRQLIQSQVNDSVKSNEQIVLKINQEDLARIFIKILKSILDMITQCKKSVKMLQKNKYNKVQINKLNDFVIKFLERIIQELDNILSIGKDQGDYIRSLFNRAMAI